MKLIIVESPTKAKTISQFVGKEYVVESSYGHVRDLPKSKLGIDIEKNFELQYITPRKSQKTVTKLKKTAAKAESLILATDEDREGEAIAWHIARILDADPEGSAAKKPIQRIVFHEITESAIQDALGHPRTIDMNMVNAQQARRVLDRLVGYKLSPFLWKKISRGLSAGRVQSVALRLIAEREEEIKSFKPEEYWSIDASLKTNGGDTFLASLSKIGEKPVEKLDLKTEKEVREIAQELERADYSLSKIEKKEMRKNPLPPFITSTLQQTAAQRLGFSSKKTMFLAQNLYENGHITYMRTDSVNLSKEALDRAEQWIKGNLGKEYQTDMPRVFKSKSRLAQEAHEAIRPTDVSREPSELKEALEKDQARLYELIWRRFLASQLPPAIFDATRLEITAEQKKNRATYVLAAHGNTLRFDGFLNIWPTKFEEKELPPISKDETLSLLEVKPEQHFTEPPPRYNEASLIKTLEKHGIGRPSTYAPIISVIQERNYVEKNQGRFYPTEIGSIVNKVLTENFPQIVDIQFTAKMEEELDHIAEGEEEWQKVIGEFYGPFAKHLEEKYESVSKQDLVNETTDEKCEKCGKPMVIKFGRFGKFMACSGFPECRNTKALKNPPKQIGMKCPKCLEAPERKENPGEVIERRVNKKGRARGKIFWGCSRYPDCDFSSWTNPLLGDQKKKEEKEEADEKSEEKEEEADEKPEEKTEE